MKKIMILGASYTQIPLFEAAKKLGIKTVAASIKGPYPCFELADESVYVNIADPDAVALAAKEVNADGVCTCGLDLGMRAIGFANDYCNLNGPSKAAAMNVSDKYLMKKALTAGGVCTAPFFCIKNEEELEAAMDQLTFPVILKAVDLMGSRGIFKSETKEEARVNFKRSMEATNKDYCLIEQFITGPLFGVEAMLQNGEFVFMMPDNTEIFKAETNIPIGHSIPLENYDERIDEIRKQVTAAVKATGLNNCPVNVDCIQHDDKVYIVELTGRSGATGLSEIVSTLYGINYYEEIIKLALGMDVKKDFENAPFAGGILTNTLTAPRNGVVKEIFNYNLLDERIIDMSFNIEKGDTVQKFTNGRDRIGQIFLKDSSLEAARQTLKKMQDNIRIDLEGDVQLTKTPIEYVYTDENNNRIYIKHEEKLPCSYGGNKVRFAYEYLNDFKEKGCGGMIIYGGYSSNLCRILGSVCYENNIPCVMVYNTDDSDPDKASTNKDLILSYGIKEFHCSKSTIADAVQEAMDYFEGLGLKPYYINGNKFGQGNVHTPMKSYYHVYSEICKQSAELSVNFDKIFLAGSTNTSHAGLLANALTRENAIEIVGISVNRNEARAREVIQSDLIEYKEKFGCEYLRQPSDEIIISDKYICGCYGKYDEDVEATIQEMYTNYNVALDPVYTGKAFTGMKKYIKENNIKNSTLLFIHTGGIPLFMDYHKNNAIH